MNHRSESSFLLIAPLIERHVGDAAFYWAQHDRSVHSPLINVEGLHSFDALLNAHLDGVRAAGDAGWQLASKALQRWNSAAEVFVCGVLAFEGTDAHRQAEVLAVVQQDPQRLLRGLISAVLWLPPAKAKLWVQNWVQPRQSALLQTAAWRIAASKPALLDKANPSETLFAQACMHSDAHVRAAACRWGAHSTINKAQLQSALADPVLAVGAEAAIALYRQGLPSGKDVLLHAVEQQNQHYMACSGYHKKVALHRLSRWVRCLALALPPGAPEVENLLETLPIRLALELSLHHGDAALLPWVQTQMHNPECARLAGWVWSCLTGVDLEEHGLTIESHDLPDAPLEAAPEFPTDVLDPGLPMPNAHAVACFEPTSLGTAPMLFGKSFKEIDLARVWLQASQALRWITVQRHHARLLNTRDVGSRQLTQMQETDKDLVKPA